MQKGYCSLPSRGVPPSQSQKMLQINILMRKLYHKKNWLCFLFFWQDNHIFFGFSALTYPLRMFSEQFGGFMWMLVPTEGLSVGLYQANFSVFSLQVV